MPVSYNVKRYGTENGLPANGIKGIQWDERTGFLWIATEAGISRFNGVEFKNYTRDNTPSIKAERMLFLVRNRAGKIYTADQTRNIFSIHKNNLIKETVPQADVSEIDKNLVLIVVSDTFFRKKIKENTTPIPFFLTQHRCLSVSDTSCYISAGNKIFYFSANMKSPDEITPKAFDVKSLFKIEDNIFVFSGDNFYKIEGRAFKPVSWPSQTLQNKDNIQILWNHTQNQPVLIQKNNAWRLNYTDRGIEAVNICNVVPEDALIDFAEYSNKLGTLFLGTNSKGLITIAENRVLPVKLKAATNKTERNSYYSQIELNSGNVLTNEGHVLGFNSKAGETLPIKGKFGVLVFTSGDSVIWYSQPHPKTGKNHLWQYNVKTKKTIWYEKITATEFDIYASAGGIYMATDKGIARLEGDTMKYIVYKDERAYLNNTFDFAELEPGKLVIATCNGLLQLTIPQNKIDTLFSSEGNCVRTLFRYKDYLMFGTYGNGFYIMKNGVIKAMPRDKNNFLAYTHCFMPDDKGFCWISTNRGLFCASLAELINAYEKDLSQVYYHYYGRNDGMDITEMNGGCKPCALRLKNNMLSFPTMDGLLWVNPDKNSPLLPDGDIYIDEILVDGVKTEASSFNNKTLPHTVTELIFNPAYTAWCNKENIYIEYQLNDTLNWRLVNTDKGVGVVFNNLSPGNYKLRLRKVNGFGINNYVYKEIFFSIAAPWYSKWWFALLILALVTGLTYLYFRLRTRQLKTRADRLERQVTEKTKELKQQNEILEKNNTIKTRLISIISHDIITPLKFLTLSGKNLQEKRKQMPDDLQQETIREMTNTSQELQLLSTNILNWIKYQNENRRLVKETYNVHYLINQVFGVLNSIARQKGLQLLNNSEETLELYQYYEPLRIVLHNLVTNAIHFTEKGSVEVTAVKKQGGVEITVKDNGVGMTPDQIKNILSDEIIISSANIDNRKGNGLGFLIIKDLLKMMDARLQIESEKGKGTRVILTL